MSDNDIYKCKDLGISAMLVALGCGYLGIDWEDNVAYFKFKGHEECNTHANLFLFGKIKVDAKSYFIAIKNLKRTIAEHNKL